MKKYLEIAKNLFSNLFDVRIDELIKTKPSSSIGEFFLIWREVMPLLSRLSIKMNLSSTTRDVRYMVIPRLIARKEIPESLKDELKKIREFRHELTHGHRVISEKEVNFHISKLQKILHTLEKIEDD